MGNASIDDNFERTLIAASTVDGKTPTRVEANPDTGAMLVETTGVLVNDPFDYISAGYPDAITEIYTYKTGGLSGITVATVTVIYTDSTKSNIDTVTRT